MDYKKSYYLLNIGSIISIIILFIASQMNENTTMRGVLAAIGFISITVNILQAIAFCRCPSCGHFISTKTKLPTYCPECGRKLE